MFRIISAYAAQFQPAISVSCKTYIFPFSLITVSVSNNQTCTSHYYDLSITAGTSVKASLTNTFTVIRIAASRGDGRSRSPQCSCSSACRPNLSLLLQIPAVISRQLDTLYGIFAADKLYVYSSSWSSGGRGISDEMDSVYAQYLYSPS